MIHKPYIEKAEAEVFSIVSVRKMRIAEKKRLKEIAGCYFSASRKSSKPSKKRVKTSRKAGKMKIRKEKAEIKL